MPTAQTGQGEVWRQVAQAGMVVSDLGLKIQDAQDAMRLSVLERDSDAAFNAAQQAMSQTRTKEEADAILAQYERQISALPAKDRARVANAYSIRLNQKIEGQLQSLSAAAESAWAKDARDQFQFGMKRAIDDGNLDAAHETAALALKTGIIGQEEYNTTVSNMPIEAAFAQARKDLVFDPAGVVNRLSDAEWLKSLNPDQLDSNDRLLRMASSKLDNDMDEFHQQYWQLLSQGNFDAIEESLSDPNNPLPVTGDGGKRWWMNLIKTQRENIYQTDLKAQSSIAETIIYNPGAIDKQDIRSRMGLGTSGGLSIDKVQEYENKLLLMADKDSALNTPIARVYLGELMNAKQDRVFSIDKEQNNVRFGQSLDSLTDYFVNYREKFGKDPSLNEVRDYYENLVSGYRTPERPFTEAKIQQTLGELESGGAVSLWGEVMYFRSGEGAVNHALRSLGPDWQKLAPDAAEIIQRKWPKTDISQSVPRPRRREVGDLMNDPQGNIRKWNGSAWELVE